MRQRTHKEMEQLEAVKHILLVNLEGIGTVVEPVEPSTTIAMIKGLLKAPPSAAITFSPVFASSFGVPLEDERTLSSYNVLDGDVLYYTTGEPPAPEAEAPKKK